MSDRQRFETEWPELAQRLLAVLRRDGVAPAIQDDILQETGLRMFKAWSRLRTDSSLLPLAVTIARRLVIDEARRNGRPVPAFDDKVVDIEAAALARMEWTAVQGALKELTPRHRSLLLAEVGVVAPMQEDEANKMARFRARRRLRELVEKVGVLPAGLGERVRRWLRAERVQLGEMSMQFGVAAQAAVVAALSLTVGASIASPTAPAAAAGEMRSTRWASTYSNDHALTSIGRLSSAGPAAATSAAPGAGHASGEDSLNERLAGIPKPPRAKGHGVGTGWFGAGGYHLVDSGESTAPGHTVRWRSQHDLRTPSCVERLEDDEVSTKCDDGTVPSGHVEVEHNGTTHRVEY